VKWTEQGIVRALVRDTGPFPYRPQFVAVPNVSWGFFKHREVDLAVVTKAGYLTEVEVKVSLSDWKADKRKAHGFGFLKNQGGMTKRFFYAAPLELAQRWAEVGIPEEAGVLGASESTLHPGVIRFETVKPAADLDGARKLTDREQADLARLAALRIWDLLDAIDRKPAKGE
jgi:hypothetical protein